jgi:TM2 domain-containing membrane protein YozV
MEVLDENYNPKSEKGFVPTVLLCFFLGNLGVHRFYVGKILTGIIMLLTLGGLGIWTIIDFIMIVTGNFTDSEGKPIKN